MSANRLLITSAAIPNLARFSLLVSFLLIPAFVLLPAGQRDVSQFGENAPQPVRSQHFLVDTFHQGEERAGILESAYSGFVEVTNFSESALPSLIRVDIFPDEAEFRKKLALHTGEARTLADRIQTYEHREINSALVRETVYALFYAATESQRARPFAWLRVGIGSAVLDNAARIDPQESRRRTKIALLRNKPADFDTLVGREELGADARMQVRYRDTAASLVGFLIREDKGLGLKALLTNIGSGDGIDRALAKAYPGRFRSMDELYDRWLSDELGMTRPPPPRINLKSEPKPPKKQVPARR